MLIGGSSFWCRNVDVTALHLPSPRSNLSQVFRRIAWWLCTRRVVVPLVAAGPKGSCRT